MSIILSPSQTEAQFRITNFLHDLGKKNKMFLLAGSAGTGKSTLISEILSAPDFKMKKIVFSATTNKAVSILQKMCLEKREVYENMDIGFLTIHKLLKIKRKINKDGEELFHTDIDNNHIIVKNKQPKSIFNYDIIVIDESSMISFDIMLSLQKIIDKMKGKVIFLGDKAQLPPVNETESIVFSNDIPNYELKEIMRYKGNLVLLANKFRDLVFDRKTQISFKEYKEKNIKTYSNYSKWILQYLKEVKLLKEKGNSIQILLDKLPIFLVYTNRICHQINRDIRKQIFPDTREKYLEGEIILFNNYYYQRIRKTMNVDITPDTNLEKNKRDEVEYEDIKYYTSQKSVVKKVNIGEYNLESLTKVLSLEIQKLLSRFQIQNTMNYEEKNAIDMIDLQNVYLSKLEETIQELTLLSIKHYILTLQDDKSIWVIHEDTQREMEIVTEKTREELHKFKKFFLRKYGKQKEIKVLLDKMMTTVWECFYEEVLDKFADISYGYSITTHKSQGSTFCSVYLHLANIINCNSNEDESYRCLYTALTRSSKKVHILLK